MSPKPIQLVLVCCWIIFIQAEKDEGLSGLLRKECFGDCGLLESVHHEYLEESSEEECYMEEICYTEEICYEEVCEEVCEEEELSYPKKRVPKRDCTKPKQRTEKVHKKHKYSPKKEKKCQRTGRTIDFSRTPQGHRVRPKCNSRPKSRWNRRESLNNHF